MELESWLEASAPRPILSKDEDDDAGVSLESPPDPTTDSVIVRWGEA